MLTWKTRQRVIKSSASAQTEQQWVHDGNMSDVCVGGGVIDIWSVIFKLQTGYGTVGGGERGKMERESRRRIQSSSNIRSDDAVLKYNQATTTNTSWTLPLRAEQGRRTANRPIRKLTQVTNLAARMKRYSHRLTTQLTAKLANQASTFPIFCHCLLSSERGR